VIEKSPTGQRLTEIQKFTFASELVEHATLGDRDELDPRIVAILDERLVAFRRNPEEGSSWEEVKARILSSKA